MQGDGSEEPPGARPGDGGGEEWTIRDFDDFVPFDEEDSTPDVPAAPPASDDPAQGSLEFEPFDPPGEARPGSGAEPPVPGMTEGSREASTAPADFGPSTAPEGEGDVESAAADGSADVAELFATPDEDDDAELPADPHDRTASGADLDEPRETQPIAQALGMSADAPAPRQYGRPAVPPPGRDDPVVNPAAGDEVPAGEVGADAEVTPGREPVPPPEDDDTMEAVFEGGGEAGPSDEEELVDVPDFASFSSEEYVQTTTQEFVDLAEEMARASEQIHEQSAISAGIRGVESGVVGLDDVIVATGDDPASIPVAPRSNLSLRVFTGLALAVIFFASLVDPFLVGLFIFVVLVLSAGEFYSAFMRAGHRPLGLFGVLGTIGALAGTWWAGLIAVPIAGVATLTATLVFFGLTGQRRAPATGAALTVLGMVWIGGMGAFMFELVGDDDYGWLIVATVVTVAVMDMFSFFVGRRAGRHRLAPRVSPKKTVEGLVGGMLAAIVVGVAFGLRDPFDLSSGLALGAVVAVVSPFGDLAVSVLKRAIGVKDMGTLLPGHGGFLDRIDAMLFVMPMAWIVFRWTGLLA